MSAFGLARQLEVDRASAQAYIDTYFSRYPSVLEFMDDTKEEAKKRGFVETIFGRRLNLPDINAKRVQLRQYAERTAINAPMQGTAADIIKLAMIDVAKWIEQNLDFDQLILEFYTPGIPDSGWVHVSYKAEGNRKSILTAMKENGKTVYKPDLIQ